MSPEAPRSPHSKKRKSIDFFAIWAQAQGERRCIDFISHSPGPGRERRFQGWEKRPKRPVGGVRPQSSAFSTANVINSYTADREKNCAQSRKRPQGERSGWRGPWLEEGLGHLLSPLPGSSSYHHTGRKGHKNSGWIQGIITIYSPAILNQHLNYQENDSY